MQSIDWTLTALPLLGILGFALYTRRFVRGVADYTSAGRCAGRYLLCNARAEADSGLSNAVANFQSIAIAGFVMTWWGALSAPVFLILGIAGFVVYRYRETRVLTLPQFFEVRYSRNFRLFMGLLAFLAGILNYGIFPAVAAKFFVAFLQLDPALGRLGMPWLRTDIAIMAGYLTFTLVMMLMGGQITLMVTDCLEGIFSHAIYLVIVAVLLWLVPWHKITWWLTSAPPSKSLVNPFDAFAVKDFNVFTWLMGLYGGVYITMAWQNRSGFNSAGRNPHETRMGGVLGNWRGYARALMITVLVLCAMTYLKHPDYAAQSAAARAELQQVKDDQLRSQAEVPVALSHLLPGGVKGLFVLVMVMGLMAADASHIHSWGSILVQDVVLPLRDRAMDPRQHIWAIRLAQIGVGLFAFCFSILFTQTQYIWMWWAITGAVFQAGAGAAIIGGLYWRRGTTAGAWVAGILGAVLSLIGILADRRVCGMLRALGHLIGWNSLPANAVTITFAVMVIVPLAYVVVSLLTCTEEFNMDRLLKRGRYRVASDVAKAAPRRRGLIGKVLGFDENFTLWDKIAAGGIFWWTMIWLTVTLVGTVWNCWQPLCQRLGFSGAVSRWLRPWTKEWWLIYWLASGIVLPFVISAVTFVWFGIGGFKDLRLFFHALRTMKRDDTDDGRVTHDRPAQALPVALPAGTGGSGADRSRSGHGMGATER